MNVYFSFLQMDNSNNYFVQMGNEVDLFFAFRTKHKFLQTQNYIKLNQKVFSYNSLVLIIIKGFTKSKLFNSLGSGTLCLSAKRNRFDS